MYSTGAGANFRLKFVSQYEFSCYHGKILAIVLAHDTKVSRFKEWLLVPSELSNHNMLNLRYYLNLSHYERSLTEVSGIETP